MSTKSKRQKGREGALSSLNVAIDALILTNKASTIAPVKAAFDSANVLLTTIRDSTANKSSYVELGLTCADVCEALGRGTNRGQADRLSPSVLRAIEQLTTIVTGAQENILKRGKRNVISRFLHKKDDKEAIATWRLGLNSVLHVFNTELEASAHPTVPDSHYDTVNTYTIISDVDSDVSNVDNIIPSVHPDNPNVDNIVPNVHPDTSSVDEVVPDVRRDVLDTHPIVSNIHHDKSSSRKGTSDQNSTTHASAPGDSPPLPPRNANGTVPDIRNDVAKAYAIISEVHRDVVNTHAMVRDMLQRQEGVGGQDRLAQNSIPGESPPPPPRIFFGRDKLVETVVTFAESLTPMALIGAGGIGKTSAALTLLHDDRIKRRFGHDRRFIRCDKFPASLPHFLRRLSKVIGAGTENPEDLTPLRPFLSSKVMLIVLDNAESILDPQGTNAREIYAVVEELSRLKNICLCITSRITTVPPDCEWLDIPTLSKEAACDTFYRIYKHGERSNAVTGILEQLDFHALSVTLLATVAHHNRWDTDRLVSEWDKRRTDMLHTDHNKSLAAAIELSLSSLMFQELGPSARELLGIVAFFPQGVDENNIDWLFPTIADRKNIFDKFCVLSLAYRSDGFITMLAPIRDYLSPKDPMLAPFLCSTKEYYFSRLSVDVEPGSPGFEQGRWIMSEDGNVEHLLDVFTTADPTSGGVWGACVDFMKHLIWYKPRLATLGPKIERLPDNHPSKPHYLFQLSRLFQRVGNYTERTRLLVHTLKLSREREDSHQLARALRHLSHVHFMTARPKEGIPQATEASEIAERIGDTAEQARCLVQLAWLLHTDKQIDAAEEVASRAIGLLPEEGGQFPRSKCHHILGTTYHSKGETEKAIHHLEIARGIASSFNWLNQLVWIHSSLALVFFNERRFDDARDHVKSAKLHAINDHSAYPLACVMKLEAEFQHRQHSSGEAESEPLRPTEVLEKVGAADTEVARKLLLRIGRDVREGMDSLIAPET